MKEIAIPGTVFSFNMNIASVTVVYKNFPRRHRTTPMEGIITTLVIKK